MNKNICVCVYTMQKVAKGTITLSIQRFLAVALTTAR